MAHDHAHASGEGAARNQRRVAMTLALVAVYMVAEAVGGWMSGSLALLADAGHMLSDVAALGLSLFAIRLSQRGPTAARTYGFQRAEVLAALANGSTLVAISIFIFIEAYRRLRQPPEILGGMMLVIAVGGLIVNIIGLFILHGGRNESLNIRGAWLHVFTDMLGSVGAIAAAALIWGLGWNLADPLISVFIGILVIYSSWGLLGESVSILMESVPKGLDMEAVRQKLSQVEGVANVHDLHVWSITSGSLSLTAHLVAADPARSARILEEARTMLRDEFHIEHVTIQIEPVSCPPHASHA